MIKKSFIGLSQPRLKYDTMEPDFKQPLEIPLPPSLFFLLDESPDNSKIALLKKGDAVTKGDRISLYEDSKEYIIAPASGRIRAVESMPGEFGDVKTRIVMDVQADDNLTNELKECADKLDIMAASRLLKSLPGKPPLDVLNNSEKTIHTLIVQGVDEDLATRTRQYSLSTAPADLKEGIGILKRMTKVQKVILTVSEGVSVSTEVPGMKVFNISSCYPYALPEMIVKNQLNMELPQGSSPADQGICFISAEAVASIGKAVREKHVCFEKFVSVTAKDGTRQQIKAVIGTPVNAVFKELNIHINNYDRVIIGGPLKGFSTFTLDHPIMPDTDAIMIQDSDDIPYVADAACINCGECIRICPANIPVNLLVRQLEAGLYENAREKFDLESCIECGLCAYVCTAKIPVVQYIRLGKYELMKADKAAEMEGIDD